MERIGDAIIWGVIYTGVICLLALSVCGIVLVLVSLAWLIGYWLVIPLLVFIGATIFAYLDSPGAQKSG